MIRTCSNGTYPRGAGVGSGAVGRACEISARLAAVSTVVITHNHDSGNTGSLTHPNHSDQCKFCRMIDRAHTGSWTVCGYSRVQTLHRLENTSAGLEGGST